VNKQSLSRLVIVLSQPSDGGRIAVDLEAYLRFDLSVQQGLDQMVARWSHFVTPHSTRLVHNRRLRR